MFLGGLKKSTKNSALCTYCSTYFYQSIENTRFFTVTIGNTNKNGVFLSYGHWQQNYKLKIRFYVYSLACLVHYSIKMFWRLMTHFPYYGMEEEEEEEAEERRRRRHFLTSLTTSASPVRKTARATRRPMMRPMSAPPPLMLPLLLLPLLQDMLKAERASTVEASNLPLVVHNTTPVGTGRTHRQGPKSSLYIILLLKNKTKNGH